MPYRNQIHVDVPLSNISIAYKNQGYIADQVFPTVSVKKDSDKYYVFDRDFRLPQTLRANKAASRQFVHKQSNSSYYLAKHALKDMISDDDVANDDLGDLKVRTTERLKDKILLRREYDVASLFTSTSWSQNVSLSAAQQFSLDTSTSNPIPLFDTAVASVIYNSGFAPNVSIIPHEVLLKIKNHMSIIDRVKYTSQSIDQAAIASLLGVSNLLVPSARIDASAEGVAASISNVWGDNCFVGYKAVSPARDIPSCGYIFTSRDPEVKTWRDEELESEVIEVNTKYQAKVVASLAGYLIKDCLA